MSRTVKQHDERLSEILDIAQALFYQKGYENTSVAEIIHAVGIAKGTFYHYFQTKDDLLDMLIGRLADAIQTRLALVVDNPDLDAITKLNTFFIDAGNYKVENREAVLLAAKIMYRDVNLKLKERLFHGFVERSESLLTLIIRQGIEEGVFQTDYGEHIARMVLYLGLYLRDEFAEVIVNDPHDQATVEAMIEKSFIYQQSIERILGAPAGSLHILTPEIIRAFFPPCSSSPTEEE
jgi:AcrR family transcriptional regulator